MDTFEDYTLEEKTTINLLRKKLKKDDKLEHAILDDDLILFKFLKGNSFKLNQTEQALKKHIKWRMMHQVDRILQDYVPLEVLENYLSQSFLGFDKEGSPIRYNAAGNVDTHGIFKSATLQDILKCVLHLIETDIVRTKEQSIKMQKCVSQFVYIYNLENLTLSKALDKKNLDTFMIGATLFQDNYPERLKTIFVINAPHFFTITFTILKTVLANELLKKIRVFGQNGWKEALLEVIDEDVLPAFLGGKRTDPDGNPLCESFVNHGYPVPEKYYLDQLKEDFKNLEDVEKVSVKYQARLEIDICVEKSGSFIEWEFSLASKDIGFGLSFKLNEQDSSEIVELIPVYRTEAVFPVGGMYYCEKPGKYIVIFDNTYSLLTSKEVFYKIAVKSKNKIES